MYQSSAAARQPGRSSFRRATAGSTALPISFPFYVRLPRLPCLPAGVGDLLLVVALALAFFMFSGEIGLSEHFHAWARDYESGQLDELPLTLLLLSVGLGGLALRHGRLTRQALARQLAAETRIAELLKLNRQLAQNLIRAQENERGALARELHDEAGQCCAAIRAEASFLGHLAGADAVMATSAGRIGQAAQQMHGAVRGMLTRLRPPCLDSLGLVPALREWCANWERQHGIACGFFPRAMPARLDDASCVALFRLVQEGLTNVARHSGADRVRIELWLDADVDVDVDADVGAGGGFNAGLARLRLVIEDNGVGMPAGLGGGGFGLAGMRERVAGLGGSFALDGTAPRPGGDADVDAGPGCDAESWPQKGVRITACLPLCVMPQPSPDMPGDLPVLHISTRSATVTP